MKEKLSKDELSELDAILTTLAERYKGPVSFENLLDEWKRFVFEVEEGYDYTIYDYTNDLSIRDLLEEILLGVPKSLYDRLILEIMPLDDRFLKATIAIREPLLPGRNALLPWWFRIPINPGSDLYDDLEADGILLGGKNQ